MYKTPLSERRNVTRPLLESVPEEISYYLCTNSSSSPTSRSSPNTKPSNKSSTKVLISSSPLSSPKKKFITNSLSLQKGILSFKTFIGDIPMTIILCFILWIQFGLYFYTGSTSVEQLDWKIVNLSILLFSATTHFYQECFTDLQYITSKRKFALVIPDIITIITLLLVCLHQVALAFVLLLSCMMILAFIVVLGNIFLLCTNTDEYYDEEIFDDGYKTKKKKKGTYHL